MHVHSGTLRITGNGCGKVQDVFQVGDRVRCLLLELEEDYARISLSTAELEANNGDMMVDPVWPPSSFTHTSVLVSQAALLQRSFQDCNANGSQFNIMLHTPASIDQSFCTQADSGDF